MQVETRSKERIPHTKRKINYWKVACLILTALIASFFIWLYLAVFVFSADNKPVPKLISNINMVPFHSQTSKADLNKLITTYLDDLTEKQDIGYDVYVGNHVNFTAKAKFLGKTIPIQLEFTPKVVDKGNIELTLRDMSVGAMPVPVAYVMRFVDITYDLPKWVTVLPKQKKIYLSLDRLKLKGGTKVRVDSLNLKKDDISFTLLVPVD